MSDRNPAPLRAIAAEQGWCLEIGLFNRAKGIQAAGRWAFDFGNVGFARAAGTHGRHANDEAIGIAQATVAPYRTGGGGSGVGCRVYNALVHPVHAPVVLFGQWHWRGVQAQPAVAFGAGRPGGHHIGGAATSGYRLGGFVGAGYGWQVFFGAGARQEQANSDQGDSTKRADWIHDTDV